jgi:hypothetical protein
MTGAFNPVKPRDPGTPKEAVAALFDEAGGVKRVMIRLDIAKSQAYALTDPQSPEQLSVARAAALSGSEAPAMANYFSLLCGGAFTPLRCDDKAGDALSLTSDAARANGEAIAELISSLRDGKLSASEAAKAMPLVEDALCQLAAVRGRLVAAMEPDAGTG